MSRASDLAFALGLVVIGGLLTSAGVRVVGPIVLLVGVLLLLVASMRGAR